MKKRTFFCVILVCLLTLVLSTVSCGNGTYALGRTGPGGGKIFYHSKQGFTMTDNNKVCHYLEAAPNDISPSDFQWASLEYIETNISGTETAIGTGRKNTDLILAKDADAPAAKACKEYSGGGKTDWFLPSKDELNELYVNRASVGNMKDYYYWSSSQRDSYNAWSQSFYDYGSGIQSYNNKNGKLLKYYLFRDVRAIRAF